MTLAKNEILWKCAEYFDISTDISVLDVLYTDRANTFLDESTTSRRNNC